MALLSIVMSIFLALVIVSHILFMVMEMFFWMHPTVRKIYGMSIEKAKHAKVMANNVGIYNGILVAGLIWGWWINSVHILTFFLVSIVIAGLYGGMTAKRVIILIQAVPALIALILVHLVWWGV